MCASGRTLAEPRLSPDGTAVVFHVRDGAGPRLIRIDLGDHGPVQPGPETALTYDPPIVGVHPSGGGSWTWTPSGSSILYVARNGLFAIPSTGGPGRAVVLSGDSISSPTVSSDGRIVAYVIENDSGQSVWAAYLDGSRPPMQLAAAEHDVFRYDPTWRPGTYDLNWHEWRMPQMAWDQSVIAGMTGVGKANVRSVAHHHQSAAVGQPTWSPDGNRLGYVCDASGWMVVTVEGAPAVPEPFEHATPTWGSGQRSWCWSPDSTRVAFNRNELGYARLLFADVDKGTTTELGKAWHLGISWSTTPQGSERLAAIRTGGVTPPQLVVYTVDPHPNHTDGGNVNGTPETRRATRTTVARGPVGGWEQCALVEPRAVTWAATDGSTLHGRLYQPNDVDTAGVIVSVHGGPTDQGTVQFNTRYAYWLSRGWAIFVPDYRGSSGHGRLYQQAMNGGWGVVDVDDVASGLAWLRSCPGIDPGRIVLMGGSAGGFTVLNMLADQTKLSGVVAAVVLYPVTDLAELDATTHRFEQTYNATIVGPPESYPERSPIGKASRFRTPLLLFHGDADPVVNVEQSRRLVRDIQTAGGQVDYVEYPDEGHGWKRSETTIDELRRIDVVLDRVRVRAPQP